MASKSIAVAFIAAAELRSGGIITEQEIKALKKRWSRHGPANKAEGTVLIDEWERVDDHAPYLISPEQTAKGIAWWRSNTLKADGTWRKNKFMQGMGVDRLYVVSCFARFELVAWYEENIGHGFTGLSPVYRMIATTGDSFDYVGRSWQSGGVEFV